MTVATSTRKAILAGNGVNTNFGFNFAVRSAADLQVYYTDAAGVQTLLAANLYAVALNPVPNGQLWAQGGSVTYPLAGAAIAQNTELTVVRNVPLTQTSVLINQGGYSPQTVEQALDLLAMAMQQVNEAQTRALTIPITSTASAAMPAPVGNAIIGWDPTGSFIVNVAAAGAIPLPLGAAQGGTGAANTSAKGSLLLGNAGTYSALVVGTNGQVLIGDSTQALGVKWGAIAAVALGTSTMGFSLLNGTLVPSQNATQLTVAIKTLAGADPSAADPVYVLFRNATSATGDYTVITLTAATSITTTVGGTFGVANAIAFRLWVVGFNDGGVFRLGLINCLTTVAGAGTGRDVTAIYPLGQFPVASSTQIGAGSTSAGVFYTAGAAVASKAYAVLGYLTYEAGLAAAGTFAVNQSRTHLQSRSDPLPGQVLQTARVDTGAVATGTTTVPIDDTIPQITEGDQYMSQAITPSSAANALATGAALIVSQGTGGAAYIAASIHQDATANAIKSTTVVAEGSTHETFLTLRAMILSQLSVATTFRIRAGLGSAGTVTFNGHGGGRDFGGVINSWTQVEEVMG